MKRRPVVITVASCLLLISMACERRHTEVPDKPTIRLVVTNADSILIEYFRPVPKPTGDGDIVGRVTDTTFLRYSRSFAEHAASRPIFMERVTEYVPPSAVAYEITTERASVPGMIRAWSDVEYDDDVRFGIAYSVVHSLSDFSYRATFRTRPGAPGHSVETEFNIQREHDLKVRKSPARTLTFRLDESNYFWWNRGFELPQRFEPALGDSLQNLLLASMRADMMLAIVVAVHPSARFDQFLRILDEVTLVNSMLGYDYLIGDNRTGDYGHVTGGLAFTEPEPGPYYIRSRLRQWTDADDRILARARQSAEPILNPSLRRDHPASEVWFYAVDQYNIVGSLEPIVDTNEVEYKTITIDGEEFPAEDQFVPVEQLPEAIFIPWAEYPDMRRMYREEIFIVVRVLVDRKGDVRKAIVERESYPWDEFDESARKAAMKSKWMPALQNQQPVAYWTSLKVEFKAEDDADDNSDSGSMKPTDESDD